MRDCSNQVRSTYVSALNGSLSYNGENVPVYGQTPFRTTPKNYVVISSITESARNTNHSFGNEVDVVIDIFSEQYRVYDNVVVDAISQLILNTMINTPGVRGFDNPDFTIYPMARISSLYAPLQNGENFIARKIITISNLVNEK